MLFYHPFVYIVYVIKTTPAIPSEAPKDLLVFPTRHHNLYGSEKLNSFPFCYHLNMLFPFQFGQVKNVATLFQFSTIK